MANQTTNRYLNIYIQSGEAQKVYDRLIAKQEKLNQQLRENPKNAAKIREELAKLEEPISRAAKKLSGELSPSLRDLSTVATKARNDLQRMSPEDAGYGEMANVFKQANKELDDQRAKVGLLSRVMKSFWQEAKTVAVGVLIGNTVESILQSAMGYITGMVTGAAKIADELSDIEKTTGLTTEQVRQLNSELSKIDTRTSNSELRKLAAEAGKLGKESVEDVRKFVEEADKIKVALGEDLGESAIIDVAKTSKIFGEEMLNMASAINEVGASSEASEAFSVDFLKRMAGTAPTVHLAADEVLGYSAALEIAGQTAEVSSTALNTFFLDFVGSVEKFGEAAGFAKGELSNILNTQGTNEAFLQFLERLKQTEPTAAGFINKLKSLGIDGARGSNVMLALANNIKTVREQQEIANGAIQSNASIMTEFNKKNNNAAAELDKLKKNVAALFASDTIRDGGEAAIRTLNSLVNVLRSIPQFIEENRFALLTLVAGIALMNKQYIVSAALTIKDTALKVANAVAMRTTAFASNLAGASQAAYIVVTNLLTGTITRATAAQRLWNIALSIGAGPLGIILVAAGALAIAIGTLLNRTQRLTAEQQLQADIAKKVAESTSDTVEKMRQLTEVAQDNNVSLGDRKKALDALISIAPEYLNGLTLENIKTAEGKKLLDEYIASLRKKAEIEAKSALLSEKLRVRDNAFTTLRTDGTGRFTNASDADLAAYIQGGANRSRNNKILGAGGDYKEAGLNFNEVATALVQINVLQKDIDTAAKENVTNLINNNTALTGSGTATIGLLAQLKQKLKDLQDQREAAPDEKTISSLNTQIKETEDRIAQLEGRTKSTSKATRDLANDWKQLQEELEQIANALLPDGFQKDLAQLESRYAKLREKAHGNNRLLLEIERLHQLEVQNLRDKYYTQSIQVRESQEEEARQRQARLMAQAQAALLRLNQNIEQGVIRGNRDRLAKMELDVIKSTGKQRLDAELALLEEQKRQELLKKDLTENERLLIEEKYRQKRKELELNHYVELTKQILDWAAQAVSILDVFTSAQTDRENAELERDRRLNEKKRQNLEGRLKSGMVTQLQYDREVQKLEKEQEKREKEVRLRQFKRDQRMQVVQALMSGAQAVVSTLAARPGSLDIISLGAFRAINIGLALATTAAQVAAIASRKAPEFARGGQLNGPSHQDKSKGMPVINPYTGQIQAYLEGKEGIINKKTMGDSNTYTVSGTPSQIGSFLNGLHGGVQWNTGAVRLQPKWSTQKAVSMDFARIQSSFARTRMYATGGVFADGSQQGGSGSSGTSEQMLQVLQGLMATNADLQKTLSNIQRHGIKSSFAITELKAEEQRMQDVVDDATATA